MNEEKGVWRTIRGRRIFIREGESLSSAMSRSGKFKNLTRTKLRETRDKLRLEDRANKWLKGNDKTKDKQRKKMYGREEINVKNRGAEQAEKNLPNEKAPLNKEGKTRVERNYPRYSQEQQREVRHENLQKKLADYKAKKQSNINDKYKDYNIHEDYIRRIAPYDDTEYSYAEKLSNGKWEVRNPIDKTRTTHNSVEEALKKQTEIDNQIRQGDRTVSNEGITKFYSKQSNNKVDPYDDPESNESQRLQSIQSRYDEYLQDTEGRGASYGEIAYVDSLRGKDLDDFEKELDDYETKKYNKQEKATKKTRQVKDKNDWLPKATEIKEQGTSNRKEVSDNIQAHILEYYSPDFTGDDIPATEAFVRQMDAMREPTLWKSGQRIAEGGSYLVYNGDMSDFLDSLKINPKGKKFSGDKAFQMYTSLIGRESERLYNKIKKHEQDTINAYKKRKGK